MNVKDYKFSVRGDVKTDQVSVQVKSSFRRSTQAVEFK